MNADIIIARMSVPKFVCDTFRTSLLIVHSIKEAYSSTLSHAKKEFRNTLARAIFVNVMNHYERSLAYAATIIALGYRFYSEWFRYSYSFRSHMRFLRSHLQKLVQLCDRIVLHPRL